MTSIEEQNQLREDAFNPNNQKSGELFENLSDDEKKHIRQIEKDNESLRKKLQEAETFLKTIQHDLRGPIVNVVSLVDFLQESMETENLNPGTQTNYNLLKEAAKSLEEQLNLLTNIPRSVYIHKVYEESLQKVLEDQDIERKIKKQKVQLYSNIPKNIELYTKKMNLMSILRNTIKNAIENTEKGAISVNIEGKGGNIIFTITNPGTLTQQQIDIFFKEKASKRENGMGLGAPLIKKHAEILGGTASAESKKGKVTVTVTIPKKQTPEQDE